MDIRTKQILSAFLAILSSGGVLGTAYLAVKQSKKAEEKKNELLNSNPNAAKSDIIKAQLPAYIPAIAVGGATVASIFASHFLSKRAEASLIASATLLEQGWRRYQYKVKDVLGIDSHKKVLSSLAEDRAKGITTTEDDRVLYYVEPIGFFKAKPEDLAWAYGDMNQRLHTIDKNQHTAYFCLLYDMLKDAKAEMLDKNVPPEKLNWGWTSSYLNEMDKPQWVHMNLTQKKLADGRDYIEIDFDEDPVFDPANGGSVYYDAVGGIDEEDQTEPSSYKKVKKSEVKDNGEHHEND